MNNVTYYFGAGASYNALPIVEEIPLWLDNYYRVVENCRSQIKTNDDLVEEYLGGLETFTNRIRRTPIDAYAHALYKAKDYKTLNVLKALLSGFFIYEQSDKSDIKVAPIGVETDEKQDEFNDRLATKIDPRYTSFLNRFTDNYILNNVNIISWNYDMQLELANSRTITYDLSQDNLSAYPTPNTNFDIIPNQKFIKLNGNAGMFYYTKNKQLQNMIVKDYKAIPHIEQAISIWDGTRKGFQDGTPFLNFSFENHEISNWAVSRAQAIMKDTHILVVIGYSFDETNWEIDTKVFEEANKLQRVYFQVPEHAYNDIINFNLPAINPTLVKKCVPYHRLDKFCVPPELNMRPRPKNVN